MNDNLSSAKSPVDGVSALSSSTTQASPPQASLLRRMWVLLCVAAVAIVTDQLSKNWIERTIALNDSRTILPALTPYLTWAHTQNLGAAFSLFQGGGTFFIIVAVVVTSLILFYAPRLPVSDWLSRVALGLQLGGAIGNVIDRFRQGHVTDFIHFQIPQLNFDWPVFNVADSCIVVGVIILVASSVLTKDQK